MGLNPYRKRYTPHARELIRHLPPTAKPFLRALIDELSKNPFLGKPLKHDLEGYFSIRHNRYRIIYTVDDKKHEAVIEFVGARENIYDLFLNLKKKKKH